MSYCQTCADYEKKIKSLEEKAGRLREALDKARMALKEVTRTPHNAARWMDFVQQALSTDCGKGILERVKRLEEAIRLTLDENAHLADGDTCTLWRLKQALETEASK